MSTVGYLRRLGLDVDLPPTLETLRAVHEAHVQQVPYENLAIMLGRPPSVAPADSLDRIATIGRAGYCFHHNGALELALRDLGFVVVRHHGHVWTRPEHRHDAELTHLVLEVSGLPSNDNPGGRWSPDAGLGEGFFDPLPLVAGTVVDGPLRFSVADVSDVGWSFINDPSGSFRGCEVRPLAVDHEAVVAAHANLSTAPDGMFTKKLIVQRRTSATQETVRCCQHIVLDAAGRHATDLTTYDDWRAALDDIGLPLTDVDPDELRALWERSWADHRAWDDDGRP